MSQSSADYTQISEFYGPGTWAAWVITLITSWIPILLNDHKHNLHYISYALYTNWAAIDLIRQAKPSADHRTLREMNDAQLQSLVAASAVVRVGIFHACLQIAMCRFIAKNKDTDTKKNIKRRLRCIAIGLLLPVLTDFFLVPYYHNVLAGHSRFGYPMLAVAAFFTAFMFLTQIMASLNNTYTVLDVAFVMTLSLLISMMGWDSFIIDSDAVSSERCSIVPCAQQTILEWDQAFSLLVALLLLMYEYFAVVVQLARKAFRGVSRIE